MQESPFNSAYFNQTMAQTNILSKKKNLTYFGRKNSDYHIESEAEEIYIPGNILSGDEMDSAAYKKIRSVNGNLFFDTTDLNEPTQPNIPAMFLVEERSIGDEEEVKNGEYQIIEEETDLDNAKKTLFNFTGMSFKDYIKSFNERLNDEIKAIVELFIL